MSSDLNFREDLIEEFEDNENEFKDEITKQSLIALKNKNPKLTEKLAVNVLFDVKDVSEETLDQVKDELMNIDGRFSVGEKKAEEIVRQLRNLN